MPKVSKDTLNDLVGLVNPLQGTRSHYGFSRGNCLPLVAMPFGMTHWSPQTDEGSWLFSSEARKLQGVRATHQPSPWIGDYGHFTVMAQTGKAAPTAFHRSSTIRPEEMVVRPDYFSALLRRYDVLMEAAPTERCAIFRFTFPKTEKARVILQPGAGDSWVTFYPERRMVTGFTRASSGGTPKNFACYFAATFDKPIVGFSAFDAEGKTTEGESLGGERLGAFVEFDSAQGQTVHMRIATSFISTEQAEENLAREIGNAGFEEVRVKANAAWNAALGKIAIEGASEDQKRTFYTCLYRTNLFPRIWHEYDKAGSPVHFSPYTGQVYPGILYTDNGFWDTYRTVYPLFALLSPDHLSEILQGWTQAAAEGGWFPQWASPGYRACMIGTHIDAVMADGYVKGIRGFDIETAYAAMIKHAAEPGDSAGNYGRLGIEGYLLKGYVPADHMSSSASRTLDYAYDDFCISQIAKVLGEEADFAALAERASSYKNVFDTGTGFVRGRMESGQWQEPFNPLSWGGAYVEGGAWQSTWGAPHDPAGLIALMGGRERFVARLDEMLTMEPAFDVGTYGFEIHEMTEMACVDFGQYAHSNQPVHHVLYLYTAAGRPDKTQMWVRRVLSELYSADQFCGDEDNGEMSAWYILSALGFYPLCPGHPTYVLGSPLFSRTRVQLEDGKELIVEAVNNSPENVYVQKVEFSGQPLTRLWIGHEELAAGGTLRFTMGATPPSARDYSVDELPFSLSQAK